MNEYDFKMYVLEQDDGSPVIVMRFEGVETMEEAQNLAEELFEIISSSEDQVELH
jgi:hypothetical protein